jgi:putative ABC transport system permease protein
MWTIALKTLVADRGKLLAALVGVAFSVVLVNVQGGLYLGLIGKASLLVDHGKAEIWVGHDKIHNVDFPVDVPRRWIDRIRAAPGVARVEPYLVGHSTMTLPDGGYEHVLLVGHEPKALLGGAWNLIAGDVQSIRQTDGVIVDVCDAKKLREPQLGEVREINGRRARIVGFTEGIQGFLVTPYIFTTIDRAAEYLRKPTDVCSYFLVQTTEGTDVEDVCAAIRNRVPSAEVFTSDDYADVSIDYWLRRTGIGISFGASTFLGVLVGLLIIAQTLYASVLDRMHEFGALKAIGAAEWQLYTIIFGQALALSLIGAVLGLACVGSMGTTLSTPIAPIVIPWWVSLGSCIAVTLVCLVFSLLPYFRVRRVDPAIVLQS